MSVSPGEIPQDMPLVPPVGEPALPVPLSSGEIAPPRASGNRLTTIVDAVKEDYQDSPNRLRNLVSGVGALAMQGLDRARTSVVLIPTLAATVFENSHNPAYAALAAGAAFTGWCAAVGGTTAEGLSHYPKAVSAFEQSFPGVVGFFEGSLPGLNPPSAEQRQTAWPQRIGRRVLTGVRRGLTVAGIGNVAYVSTAAAQGRSKAEVHKLNLNASVDGGAVVGGIVYGLGQTILEVAKEHPMVAQSIQEQASDIRLWYGVAGVMMASQWVTNKVKKWRSNRADKKRQEA